ncbi:MAG: DNA-processing protein DprA [Oligoflexales bacterium]
MNSTLMFGLTHTISQYCSKWIPFESEPGDRTSRCPKDVSQAECREALSSLRRMNPDLEMVIRFRQTKESVSVEAFCDLFRQEMHRITAAGGHYITFNSIHYPESLRTIGDPPMALFVLGDLSLLTKTCMGVIGSRKASAYAQQTTRDLALSLALSGVTIVSGGAFGCDSFAHWGALQCPKDPVPTIVVCAGGLQRLYPSGNYNLFSMIRKRGGIFLSEKFWNYQPRPFDFPIRNRLVSGLSEKVFVMQAALTSGAMITANLALDQGKDVWVLKHPSGDVRASGNEKLISEGATFFENHRQVINK